MATIIKRGNSYLIRVDLGRKAKGERPRKNFTWKPEPGRTEKQIQKDLLIYAANLDEQARTGRVLDGSIKFNEFADKWLTLHAEKQLAPKTVYEYRKQLVRINRAIGHLRLDRLQPAHLIEFYDNLGETGIREDAKYKSTDKLAVIMEEKHLNGSRLARLAHLGNSTAQVAVKGHQITRKSAEALARALETPLADIFQPADAPAALSGNSVLHYHRLISSILSTAVEWQVIMSNPADRARAPRAEKKEAKYLDDVEAKQMIKLLDVEPIQYRTMITLLIFSGLRRGELCGLKWPDIDFENNMLHVQQAVQYLPGKGLFEIPPKRESQRVIKLPAVALRLLLEHKNAQAAEKEACGDQWLDNDLVFTRWNGTYFNPDDLTSWFSEFIKKNNLREVTPHSLRHTNATLMIAAGTDLRTVSKRLGHAQTSTTANIYAHAIRSADEAAADAIDNILDPMKKLAGKKEKANNKGDILKMGHKRVTSR